MLGFIKKDFLVMKSSLKAMAVMLAAYIIFTIIGIFDFTLMVPLLGMIVLISTFSYDEQSGFNAYASTLPSGRKNIVRSKYLSSVLIILMCGIIAIIIAMMTSYKNNNIDFINIISSLFGSVFGILLVISIMYPLIFKFGIEKGRIWIFLLTFGGAALMGALWGYLDFSLLKQFFRLTAEYFYIIIPLVSLFILFISYKVSEKIVLKKEY